MIWIANCHEHETLLRENEEEKLSKEEQEMAWEEHWRTFAWHEVQRVSPDESTLEKHQRMDDKSASEPKKNQLRKLLLIKSQCPQTELPLLLRASSHTHLHTQGIV